MVKHSVNTSNKEEEEDRDDEIIIGQLEFSSTLFPWYRSHALWSNMMAKTFDETYKCHANFLDVHPAITTKMRSVLCDWLIEVKQSFSIGFSCLPGKFFVCRFPKFIIFIEKHIISQLLMLINTYAIQLIYLRRNYNCWV